MGVKDYISWYVEACVKREGEEGGGREREQYSLHLDGTKEERSE